MKGKIKGETSCRLRMTRSARKRKGLSPVIASVLLVTVALSIAVAVSSWMSGISTQYTRFEKIELISAYCELKNGYYDFNGTPEDAWELTLDLRNTGTSEASLVRALLNAKGIADYGSGATADWIVAFEGAPSPGSEIDFENGGKITLSPGSSKKVTVLIAEDSGSAYNLSSGTTIEISLHSGAGNTYMKMITLT